MAFAPELVASVGHDYLYSDKTVAQVAFDHKICVRDIARLREREGWPKRNERIHGVPPAVQALRETEALLAVSPLPPRSGGEGGARSAPGGGRPCEDESLPPTPDPSPPLATLVGGGESAPPPLPSALERIERLVLRELAAEEAAREQLGPLPRTSADAQRCAGTLATLTQTLHALARLRGGFLPDQGSSNDDDDMPANIDDFRNELARRIDAFVASRTDGGDARGASGAAVVDEAR